MTISSSLVGSSVATLEHGTIHLWLAQPHFASPRLEDLLSDDEWRRGQRFIRRGDRERHLVACALIRIALGTQMGISPGDVELDRRCPRCGDPHGRPRLRDRTSRIELSVSHSGNLVAVAIAQQHPLGVDVEEMRPLRNLHSLEQMVLSAKEVAGLRRLPDATRSLAFLTLWTRKEAVLKALHRGLELNPRQLVVSAHNEEPRVLAWPPGIAAPSEFSLAGFKTDADYVGSVAIKTSNSHIVMLDGRALLTSWLEHDLHSPTSPHLGFLDRS